MTTIAAQANEVDGASTVGPRADAARILLADGNAYMRDYLRRLLEGAGHHVMSVTDGEAALAAIRGHRPDLLVTDAMVARLDGLELLRAVRGDTELRDLPVILLSARAGEEARVEGWQTQADTYLVKPFSARELLARVGASLGIARVRRQALQEQRELIERLREAEARFHVVGDTGAGRTAGRDRLWQLSEDLLVAADYGGRLLRVSPSWTRMLGYDEAYLLATDSRTLIHPDDLAAVVQATETMRRTGQPVRAEDRLRAADGSWRWIEWALAPEAGGTTLFGIGRDITAERAARDALLAQLEERERIEGTLRQMQRLEAVGQLTSGIAHEFNNLLAVILGNIEFVGRHVSDAKLQRRLAMMRSAAQRGASLTGQLLAFSRRLHLDPKPLDLNDSLRSMGDLLRSTLGDTVLLDVVLKAELPAALVDQTQLELVVLNLAINARDAMPVGGALTIATGDAVLGSPQRAEEPEAGDYVVVSVTDSGTGMPPEVLDRVFEPFFTTKDPGRGSGLGLPQVYGFAKQSGGGVRIVTAPGAGTTVHVYLPRAAEAVPPPVPAAAFRSGETLADRKLRALLVDDDADVRATTRTMLEELGLQVTEVAGAAAVLERLECTSPGDGSPGGKAEFDVLLIDFAMPGMNGAELGRRAAARHPGLPIALITGYADIRALPESVEWPIIRKPFLPEQLAASLRAMLGTAPPPDRPLDMLEKQNG